MTLSIEEVDHIAKLARLELSSDEKAKYQKSLTEILDYVELLNELDTKGVEPMFGALEFVNRTREDKIEKEFSKEELLKNAPEVEGSAVKVPKMN